MNKLNIHFMELKNEELSCVLGGGQREGSGNVLCSCWSVCHCSMRCWWSNLWWILGLCIRFINRILVREEYLFCID